MLHLPRDMEEGGLVLTRGTETLLIRRPMSMVMLLSRLPLLVEMVPIRRPGHRAPQLTRLSTLLDAFCSTLFVLILRRYSSECYFTSSATEVPYSSSTGVTVSFPGNPSKWVMLCIYYQNFSLMSAIVRIAARPRYPILVALVLLYLSLAAQGSPRAAHTPAVLQ